MKRLLHLPSLFLCLPILLACAVTLLVYDLPADYLQGMWLLVITALGIMMIDTLAGPRLPPLTQFRRRHYVGTRESFVALAYAGVVMVFCLLDLALFPIPLVSDPSSYATMEGGHEHIRHVSDMCWTLPVIGVLCARRR